MQAPHDSEAVKFVRLSLMFLAFAAFYGLWGSRWAKPPGGRRYAQARGSWSTDRWLRWVLLAFGVGSMVIAAVLAV